MLVYHFIFDHVKENERKRGRGQEKKVGLSPQAQRRPDNRLEGTFERFCPGGSVVIPLDLSLLEQALHLAGLCVYIYPSEGRI